uniref:L-type lectin-domain containing receptor kinase IX.2-like n=1 Tax=Erigeron canadensis TaxID=72917 RepID=UPI001CB9B1C4|nr:L-type lectin-domain containing receptor kinase IX.2-like [Erigeron canadensis]
MHFFPTISLRTDGMQLIPDRNFTAGQGIYKKWLHIWDRTSNELASFCTKFSSVIESNTINEIYADGLTFFLAENNSVWSLILSRTKSGIHLELSPKDHHAGINSNSLISSIYKKWSINITRKAHCQASVTYDSVSKNLSVFVTDDVYGVIDLNYIIHLRKELLKWVIFGFSAGGRQRFEKVTVTSWSFNSTNLQVDERMAPPPGPGPKKGATGQKVGFIVGLAVVLSFSTIIVCYYLWRRNKHRRHEMGYDADMNKDFEHATGPKRFSYNEILRAVAEPGS